MDNQETKDSDNPKAKISEQKKEVSTKKPSKKNIKKDRIKEKKAVEKAERKKKKRQEPKGYICTYEKRNENGLLLDSCGKEFGIWKNARQHMIDSHEIKKPKLKNSSERFKKKYNKSRISKDKPKKILSSNSNVSN
jgi:hypothetical protein